MTVDTIGSPTLSASTASEGARRDADGRGGAPAPLSPRSAKRKVMLITLAGTLALIGLVAGAYYFAMRPVTLRIAVGPTNSDDVKVIQTMAQVFARQHESVRLRPVLTDSVNASAAAIKDGTADLAVVRGDLDIPKNAQAVATLRKNVVMLLVPSPPKTDLAEVANAGKITSIAQLAGRRICVIGRTQANVKLLHLILRQYGVEPDQVNVIQLAPPEVSEAVRNHKADAYLVAGPIGGRLISETIAAALRDAGSPIFLPIDAADAIVQNNPVYDTAEIPAGVFGGAPARPQSEIKTISFGYHIVARDTLSEATVAALTREIFAIRQEVATDFPLAAKIETPDTDKDAVLPAHPGAAAYVDGEEKSFMDRYGDYIWWALMGLSALGSLGAWFASYFKRDERTSNTSHRGRLLDMLALARRSDSIEELDRMQAEADDILRSTLDCFERGGIEQGALTAFSIALEQFHNAVADRKMWLATLPPNEPKDTLKANVQLIASSS
ncbi:MAG: TAXI family TRAP transporter solute-binding subunit [Xanthobacteraceae bacterium]